MTMVNHGSAAWALLKTDEDLLNVFQRNCQRFLLSIQLTDRISNINLHEKYDSIPLSWAIVKEKLRCLQNGYMASVSLFPPETAKIHFHNCRKHLMKPR